MNAWKCDLDKVKSHLSLLDREVELSKMTAQFDQLGTELPLALCICNEVIKGELEQVTAKLSELGSALGPDPDPFVRVHGHDEIWNIRDLFWTIVKFVTLLMIAVLFLLFRDFGIPYIVRGFFYDKCPVFLKPQDRWEEYMCNTLFDVSTRECETILVSPISGVMSHIKGAFAMMYVYNMTVSSDPVDNVDMNVEVLADLSDVSVWTFISELNHCSMIVAHNTIMSVFE
jgi:hypothetical protein